MSGEAAALAREAGDIVQTHGLAQGVFQDMTGRVCMYGALNLAAGCNAATVAPCNVPAYREAEYALAVSLDCSILTWNDEPGRTAAEVAKKFYEIADDLEFAGSTEGSNA